MDNGGEVENVAVDVVSSMVLDVRTSLGLQQSQVIAKVKG